jgi:hypothetical protein
MPRRCKVDPAFTARCEYRDWVIPRRDALEAGLSRRAIDHRLECGDWQAILPGVYLAQASEPTRRQMLIAALAFAGPESAIDAADACRWHGLKAVAVDDARVHVVLPWDQTARSRGFVVVRRTIAAFRVHHSHQLRVVDPATAVIAATRSMRSDRLVLAALSDALQRKVTTHDDLIDAHIRGPARNARLADEALAFLSAGARSVPEADFLRLAAASAILPKPICNALVRLPGGRLISPDALFVDAGVVHETNGRMSHRREDLFEDMQERHDAMTAAGLTVLHNTPRRIAQNPREVITQVERSYLRVAGRGLPPGVELLSMAG